METLFHFAVATKKNRSNIESLTLQLIGPLTRTVYIQDYKVFDLF